MFSTDSDFSMLVLSRFRRVDFLTDCFSEVRDALTEIPKPSTHTYMLHIYLLHDTCFTALTYCA